MLHLPVDWVGFVFAESRRRIAPERAGALIRRMRELCSGRPTPSAVGVFVNPDETELQAVMAAAPLDIVQLHGPETPAFCRWVRETFPQVRVIKVFSLAAAREAEAQSHGDGMARETAPDPDRLFEPYAGAIDYVLLDTHDPIYGGGSGRTFNWPVIPAYREAANRRGWPLLVAGGLTPDNVGRLIADYGPDGVDVSSGVETDGKKDIAKITAFVERVKADV